MKKKLNCWEFMQCGREPGGPGVKSLGVCPVCTEDALDGVHGGKNCGRACWALAGTSCSGTATGKFATKFETCFNCEFFKLVREEEGSALERVIVLCERLDHKRSSG